MAIKLKVTQVKSGIGQSQRQKLTLKGLGLMRMHRSVILNDTLAIRGMIRKVKHLVAVEPAE
jgi:large subunit ribosomal protein L30